ncbi:amidohydrolase [Colletotrichum karsti]|uniref:Amidohydrolase n=1 Tax=Colletotrichum karsti TaxID=1095194 RepID=A0A9P6I8W4_9PEZI|nr:amidohydrolase [Colletotrichum karsti]KAF9879338.1 amidohydrolase [Colletotrichum karsti]
MTKILIQNVRVFDSDALRDPANVVITRSAGNIEALPTAAADDDDPEEKSDVLVDGHGCTLIPGLIDVYANIKGANAALATFASHGVTTVIDLSSNTQQCQALRVYAAGRTRLPTVLTSGTEATPARDHQPQVYDNPDGIVIRTAADAVAFAAAKASGPDRADFVKVIVDRDSPNDALLKTMVDAAHAHGKLVIARTTGKASYVRGMRAGFDIFAHAPLDEPLDADLAREMAAQGKVFVPTLSTMKRRTPTSTHMSSFSGESVPRASFPTTEGLPASSFATRGRDATTDETEPDAGSRHRSNPGATSGSDYRNAADSVRTLYEAGVTVCAGTTANLVPGTQVPFGESLHEELRLLVDAGLSRLDALRAATCVAAKAFRLGDRGIVRGGLRADLLLIEGNPLEDISATRNIRRVWIQGEDVEPANLAV